jgi:predicted ATPase
MEGFVYRWDKPPNPAGAFLFDAEQHNPRMHLELFESNPRMKEFVSMASHGQVMLAMFNETFPSLAEGTVLLLDEPEMALSAANQRRVLGLLKKMTEEKKFRIICATHSPIFTEDPATAVIDLDRHINRNVFDPGAASDTIQ